MDKTSEAGLTDVEKRLIKLEATLIDRLDALRGADARHAADIRDIRERMSKQQASLAKIESDIRSLREDRAWRDREHQRHDKEARELDERVTLVEREFKIENGNPGRIVQLETQRTEFTAWWKLIIAVGAIAGVIGGVIAAVQALGP